MARESTMPDSDLVYSICYETYRPQLLRIALLLDLFSPLADGPADAQVVARACGSNPVSTQALLDYLSHLKLVERQGDCYALTPTAATFFVRGARGYAGDWVLMDTGPQMWDSMLAALRTGRPSYHTMPWAQDAWLESYRPSRRLESLQMWRAAGIEPGQRTGLRVLDVACGCGIKSLALAQVDPGVRVTCVDSADVLEVTRDLAGRLAVLPQVTFLPGDLHTMDLGVEACDAALLGQITYYLTPGQNLDLFQRMFGALSPGGTLVIDALMTAEEPDEVGSQFTALLRALTDGAAHPFADYRTWLEGAGFAQTRQLSDRWLSATRA